MLRALSVAHLPILRAERASVWFRNVIASRLISKPMHIEEGWYRIGRDDMPDAEMSIGGCNTGYKNSEAMRGFA